MPPDIPAADLRALERFGTSGAVGPYAVVWEDGDGFGVTDRLESWHVRGHAIASGGRIYRRAPDTPSGWERVEE